VNIIDTVAQAIKKQPGKRYRLVRLDPANMAQKKFAGYELVNSKDPEVQGTILAGETDSAGLVRVGGLALARISEKRAEEIQGEKDKRQERRLQAIEQGFLAEGEKVKRSLGSSHKEFTAFVEKDGKKEKV